MGFSRLEHRAFVRLLREMPTEAMARQYAKSHVIRVLRRHASLLRAQVARLTAENAELRRERDGHKADAKHFEEGCERATDAAADAEKAMRLAQLLADEAKRKSDDRTQ